MDEGYWSGLSSVAGLIVVHAVIELFSTALMNLRQSALRERVDNGDRQAKRLLRFVEDRARLNLTVQMVLMLVRFALVAVATVQLALPWVETQQRLNNPNALIPEIGFLAALLPLALLTYLFGSLIPSAIGASAPNAIAPYAQLFMRGLMLITSPLILIMQSIYNAIARVCGGQDMTKSVTEEEIIALVDVGQKGGTIESGEKEMIYSVLQFGETLVREVMVPRPDMIAVEAETQIGEALAAFMNSGHSRIPVYEERIDDVKGVLYAKDLLPLLAEADGVALGRPVREVMRPAYFVPETKRADTLFKDMQQSKMHIAIIVDEYGGTSGLVTIEDLIEEIVGDIKDEYDVNEEAEYVEVGVDEYVVDGAMNLDDLNALLRSSIPTDENDSIGGYIYSRLGRVPEAGETLEEHGLSMRVAAVEARRIRKVLITRAKPPAPPAGEDDEAKAAPKPEPRSNHVQPVEHRTRIEVRPKTANS